MSKTYDIVVMGAGHNGLVAACLFGQIRQESLGAGASALARRRGCDP